MGLAGVSWTRHGESVGLRKGGIELESLFSVTLTCPPYARGRRLSKTQNTQCTKCTKKTQKTQCTRCTKGGRWKIADGRGRWVWAVGGRVVHGRLITLCSSERQIETLAPCCEESGKILFAIPDAFL